MKKLMGLALVIGIFSPTLFSNEVDAIRQLCLKLEADVNERSAKVLNEVLSEDLMFERMKRFNPNENFVSTLKEGLTGMPAAMKRIVDDMGEDGHYHLLKIYKEGGHHRAVFRHVGLQGFNYHDYIVVKKGDHYQFSDFFIFSSGSYITETLYQALALLQGDQSEGLLSQILNFKSNRDERALFAKMIMANSDRDYPKVIQSFQALPEKLKKEKSSLMAYLSATQNTSPEAYVKAVESYRKYRPKDPNLNILLIDYFLSKRQFEKAVASVDAIIQTLGGDPYLECIKGNIWFEKGDLKTAVEAYEKGLKGAPKLMEPYDGLLAVHLSTKNYEGLTSVYKRLSDNLEIEIPDSYFEQDPDFAEWIKTDSYLKWRGKK